MIGDTDQYSVRVEAIERSSVDLQNDAITAFCSELDRTIAEAYADGAIAVDVVWVADERDPVPRIVAWYNEIGTPDEAVDELVDHVIRYDLESVSPKVFLETLDQSAYEWEDIVPEVDQ